MYIFIFEDGTIRKKKTIHFMDMIKVEDNYLEIIDITNPLKPLYCLGEDSWVVLSDV